MKSTTREIYNIIKSASVMLFSNIISLTISIIITLVFPKFMSVESYGYFQLYVFYTSYAIFGHFGIIDGIYIRYGGVSYDYLTKLRLGQQFFLLMIIECIILAFAYACFNLSFFEEGMIVYSVLIVFALATIRIFFSQLMQTTADFVSYSKTMLLERCVFIVLSLILLSYNCQYEYLIISDLFARCVSLLYSYRKVGWVVNTYMPSKLDLQELFTNWKIGINIYLSNFSSMVMLGILRFLVEQKYGIFIFSQLSLALSGINAFMVMSNAIGMSLFPNFRRVNDTEKIKLYRVGREIGTLFGISVLVFYYPARIVLSYWLPNYELSFVYMKYLFPICVFDLQWMCLISTYMKVYRMEKNILIINSLVAFLCVLVCYVGIVNFDNLEMTMMLVATVFFLRIYFGYAKIDKKVCIEKKMFYELYYVVAFFIFNYLVDEMMAWMMYVVLVAIYIYKKRSIYYGGTKRYVYDIRKRIG